MFSGFNGVDVAVHSLERSLPVFTTQLGLRQMSEIHQSERGYENRWVRLGLDGAPFLSLIEATGDGPVSRYLARRGQGLYQLSLNCSDLVETVGGLRERGMSVILEQPIGGGPPAADPDASTVSAFVHPRSTGGLLIEIIKDGH